MSTRRRRARGSLEQEVIACLVASGRPMTVAEVQLELDDSNRGDGPAYTTVMTTLTRLHQKHAVSRRAQGRAYEYELVGDPSGVDASVTAHRMFTLLAAGTDRHSVLSRFVDGLDPDSERFLRDIVRAGDAPEPPDAEA